MDKLKHFIKKILYKENASSEDLLNFLRAKGAKIGSNVTVYAPNKTLIDKTAPWLLKIGNFVRITEGVKILTHDYSWSVLKRFSSEKNVPGAILGCQNPVEIGDNVFIGMNAIVTCGVKIGDNVIIGAGSVVTKDCDDNGVYAGTPAKKIMDIEEFYERRKEKQFEEAKALAKTYKERFSKDPPIEIFSEYFMLFMKAEDAVKIEKFKQQMQTSNNFDECIKYMKQYAPMFEDYESFLNACYK